MRALTRPFVDADTYRMLLYLATALPLGALELTLLVAGWTLAACLAVTPLIVFVVIGFQIVVRTGADAERSLARALLGAGVRRPAQPPVGGLWRRTGLTLIDGAFWKEQAFMLTRATLGSTLAFGELLLIAVGGFLALTPIHYRWSTIDWGFWTVDTLGEAFVMVPIGLAAIVVAFALVRPLRAL
jgi:Putative sensor